MRCNATPLLALLLVPAACAGAPEPPPDPAPVHLETPAPAADPAEAAAAAEEARREAVDAALAEAGRLREGGNASEALDVARSTEKELGDDARLRLDAAWSCFTLAEEAFLTGSGDKFLVKGHLADAHLRLDQALAMDADLPTAQVLLAKLHRYEENPDGAREVLTALLLAHPDDVGGHRELGDMEFSGRNWARAAHHYGRVCELDPADGLARYRHTFARQWIGAAAGEVEQGYLEAARLLPEANDPIRMLMKNAGDDRGRKLAQLGTIVEQNPSAAWARVWTAYVLREGDAPDLDQAIVVLQEAAAAAPENAAVRFNLAAALVDAKRFVEAVESYTAAVGLGSPSQMMDASNALDRLLYSTATIEIDRDVRDRAYDTLIEKNPGVGRFPNNAGLWYRDVGRDYAKSLKYYQASVDAEPEDQDFLNDCGLIYLFHMADEKAACLPYFEKVLRLVEEEGQDPIRGYWDTLENLCKWYFEAGEYEQVVTCAEKRARNTDYPSRWAVVWRQRAQAELAKSGD